MNNNTDLILNSNIYLSIYHNHLYNFQVPSTIIYIYIYCCQSNADVLRNQESFVCAEK